MTTPSRQAVEAAQRINTKHGHARVGRITPEYRSWAGMIDRCENPTDHAFPRYGGRGITVCRRWRASFTTFLADMGLKPSLRHSLDRKNGNRSYTPKNCRWATPQEQSRNRRGRHRVTIKGERLLIAEWAERSGLPVGRIWKRLQVGWPPERAVFAPLRADRRRAR